MVPPIFYTRKIAVGWGLIIGFWIFITSCRSNHSENKVIEIEIPETLTFGGDTIPLDDPDIRERLVKELWINVHWHSNTAQLIRKSGRWFPIIDSILDLEKVPRDFRYLVAIESSFENVTSNKGAVGFWQLMEPTAKELGLYIDAEIDERLHPIKSTKAACQYLKKARSQLGNWAAVAASYNIGVQGLKNVMNIQYTDNFYDVMINAETGRYLFRALACKLILENPQKYGYDRLNPVPTQKYRTGTINESISDLSYWCRKNGFSYKCFRVANPWIKGNSISITDSITNFEVLMPEDCRVYTKMVIPAQLKSDSQVIANQKIIDHMVNEKNMVALKEKEQSSMPKEEYHVVGKGENLEGIANRYQKTLPELFLLNPGLEKKQNRIEKGLKIRIN